MGPQRRRGSWFSRLPPEVRIIGLVVIISAIIGAIVLWPHRKAPGPQKLMVVAPADGPIRLALIEARRPFATKHKDIDVVFVDAQDQKMRGYEAMWRKGKSRVDLLIGAEGYLEQWADAGLLDPWDQFVAEFVADKKHGRLAHAGLEAGTVGDTQQMLPVALEMTCLRLAAPGDLAAPDSLADLASAAQKLSAAGKPALGADWDARWALPVALSTAYAAGSQQTTAMLVGRVGEALAWWRGGVAQGWAAKPGAGSPVLTWGGLEGWTSPAAQQRALWLPPGAAKRGTICLVYGALIPQTSQHKRAAQLFAREVLLSDKFQLGLARQTGLLPVTVANWAKLAEPGWKALTTAAASGVALSPELRRHELGERFARVARSCIEGKVEPQEVARLAGLTGGTGAGR